MTEAHRGELWWSTLDAEWPVLLLAGDGAGGFRAIRTVAPATVEQRRGFLLLSASEAAEGRAVDDPAVRAAGIEVLLAGLDRPAAVRVALPGQGRVFCTWELTLTCADLTGRAGRLPDDDLREVELALRLSAGQ